MATGGVEELEKSPASFKSNVCQLFDFPVKCTDAGRRVVDKTMAICPAWPHTVLEATSPWCVSRGTERQDTTTTSYNSIQETLCCRIRLGWSYYEIYWCVYRCRHEAILCCGKQRSCQIFMNRRRSQLWTNYPMDLLLPSPKMDGPPGQRKATWLWLLTNSRVGDVKSCATDTATTWESQRHESGQALIGAVAEAEWKLERPNSNIPVTKDKAKNQVNAVIEAGLGPEIACFAHVINLASHGISVNQMGRLLGRIRKVVFLFQRKIIHQSTSKKCYSYRPTGLYTMSRQDGTPLMTPWSAILGSRQLYTLQ